MQRLRFGRAEILFFIFYFFVLQFLSDLQYYLEFGENLQSTIIYRLIATPFTLLPYLFFYKMLVPLLFEKRHVRFTIAVVLFFGLQEVYLHLLDGLLWHMPLLDDASRLSAKNNWLHVHIPLQSLWLTFMNLVAITGFAHITNRWREERAHRELKQQHLVLELTYLKAQLHPHFFFNTLNNIYSLALCRSEKTAAVVAQLADLMRYVIYEGSKPAVPLQQEIRFLHHYVQLERIRHESEVPIQFICEGKTEGLEVPPLLLMPLLENAFKHGFANSEQPTFVEAVLLIKERKLSFTVKNSSAVSNSTATNGIGLQNLKKQLQFLYPDRHTLHIRHEQNVFDVHLTLHL